MSKKILITFQIFFGYLNLEIKNENGNFETL